MPETIPPVTSRQLPRWRDVSQSRNGTAWAIQCGVLWISLERHSQFMHSWRLSCTEIEVSRTIEDRDFEQVKKMAIDIITIRVKQIHQSARILIKTTL